MARTKSAGVQSPVAASELGFSLVSRQLPLESRVYRTLPAVLNNPFFAWLYHVHYFTLSPELKSISEVHRIYVARAIARVHVSFKCFPDIVCSV